MHDPSSYVTNFARTRARPRTDRVFGIKDRDRAAHMYIIGKTGTGKTTLLETLVSQDIATGHGVTLIDPHGISGDSLLIKSKAG